MLSLVADESIWKLPPVKNICWPSVIPWSFKVTTAAEKAPSISVPEAVIEVTAVFLVAVTLCTIPVAPEVAPEVEELFY